MKCLYCHRKSVRNVSMRNERIDLCAKHKKVILKDIKNSNFSK
jgi:hypothetical protein